MITHRLMANQANEHSEVILPRKFQSSYSKAVELSVQNELGTSSGRPSRMESELRYQNFDLVKFR